MRAWWRDRDLVRASLERDARRRGRIIEKLRIETRFADTQREVRRGTTMSEIADVLDRERWETAAMIRILVQLRAWNRDGCPGEAFPTSVLVAA